MADKTYLKTSLAIFTILFLFAQLSLGALPGYEIIDLGRGTAYGVNDRGQVVGLRWSTGRAFLWDRTTGMTDLGTLGGSWSVATAINDAGQVIGWSRTAGGENHVFLWDRTGGMIDLGTLPGDAHSTPGGINNAGQVVGRSGITAFLWEDGNMIDLGTLGGSSSQALAINNIGHVVGGSHSIDGSFHAFIWDSTHGMIDLGTLGHSSWSTAHGINNRGQIVGISGEHVFLWEDGGMIDLGTLWQFSEFCTINDAGQIVGAAEYEEGEYYAFYWDTELGMIRLDELLPADSGWAILSFANDISNRGQIVGEGINDAWEWEYHAFVMTPVLPAIYYVDDDANGANNGSTWADAFNYLQDSLAAAASGDEIWVAQGIYRPDQGGGITAGDRTATFQLINGVTLKGGYAGLGEPDPNARDIELYETILSGDLLGNDDPDDWHTKVENSYHVVTAYEVDETTCLEGFTISGGNANGKSGFSFTGYDGNDGGGGMLINASWPTEHSSPIISNCLFRDNRAVYGAGIYSYRGPATIENCIFEGNIAERYGGGIHSVLGGGTKIVKSCRFIDNQAFSGGGLHYFYSRATVTNCVFAGNFAHLEGSAIFTPTGTVTNCTFYGNHVDDDTAVVVNGMGDLYIINSILWDDTHSEGYYEIAALTYVYISHCDVRGGEAGVYIHPWGLGDILNWGPGNIDADPLFVDPGYWDTNSTPAPPPSPPGPPLGPPLPPLSPPPCCWVDGDYHLLPGSPCIDAGDPNYAAEPNETDLDGKPRVIGGRIDMGAYEYSPPIPAEVRIVPRSINPASMGKWITCYIWLPEDYNVADIDPNSVFLENAVQAASLKVDEEQQVAVARFSRSEVQEILEVGDIELTITGQLTDGTVFEGTDIIRVIDKGGDK